MASAGLQGRSGKNADVNAGFTNIAEWYVQAESLQGDGSKTRQEIPHTAGCKASL